MIVANGGALLLKAFYIRRERLLATLTLVPFVNVASADADQDALDPPCTRLQMFGREGGSKPTASDEGPNLDGVVRRRAMLAVHDLLTELHLPTTYFRERRSAASRWTDNATGEPLTADAAQPRSPTQLQPALKTFSILRSDS
jgi:hypothetical protein